MKYISEGRAMYEDEHHGMFSKPLAEWAISNMKAKDATSGELKRIKPHTIEETETALKQAGIELPEAFRYSAWYLYNMSFADYPKALKTDEQRAQFVAETLCDPDGHPESVLECFATKMCLDEVPIHWERFL